VQGPVRLPVPAAVESVPACLAGGGLQGCDTAAGGEGGFRAEPVGVVAAWDSGWCGTGTKTGCSVPKGPALSRAETTDRLRQRVEDAV
jgi:hypothetical protein